MCVCVCANVCMCARACVCVSSCVSAGAPGRSQLNCARAFIYLCMVCCLPLQNVLELSHANADFVCMHLQNVLELGTYVAYSAIRIMTVAPDTARLFTVETSVSETFGLWYLALLCVHYCSVLECVLLLLGLGRQSALDHASCAPKSW